jgi:hypothetical protein
MAWSQSGLIDSGVKVRRNNCRPTARPSHFSQRQMMPVPVRISVNGIRQAGQRSSASIAGTCSGSCTGCKIRVSNRAARARLQRVSSILRETCSGGQAASPTRPAGILPIEMVRRVDKLEACRPSQASSLTFIGCKPMPPFGLAVPVRFSKIFE